MSQPALGCYLNDHLSGSEVAVRLLTRLSRRYARTATGRFFADLLEDIRADQQALRDLVRLEARAVDQHTRVEHRRLAMARTALGPRDRRPPSRHTGRRHDGARPLARVPEGIPAGAPR